MTQLPPRSNVSAPIAVGHSLPNCGRCGHKARAHRLPDDRSPVDPDARNFFRCVGYEQGGKWIDTDCDCPAYTGWREVQHG